eukprot:3237284-Pleurochrysis_carterae.AAC.1
MAAGARFLMPQQIGRGAFGIRLGSTACVGLLGLSRQLWFKLRFRQQCASVGPIEFKIALELARLGSAQHVADSFQRTRQITCR